ncbi:MAG: restriction endonuclease [Candidatus Beckwithbacteria bacterium]|nr:restriction endonuclease [Candidatus Beckwithbacteria bacterium]
MSAINIIKASGEKEVFLESKVRQSLQRAGVKAAIIDKILVNLIGQLYDGITTKEIYTKVFALLNQYQFGDSYRYTLKEALMALGPSGYPFEKFVARLLNSLGFHTQTQVIVKGRCIDHEIDVVAEKDNLKFLIECKFHNRPGTKSHSKDVLYTEGRFEDVTAVNDYHGVWLVTNTKLTQNAVKYGECRGMKLLAWRYPTKDSLEQLIETYQLYPVTCFAFLEKHQLEILIQNNLVLCSDVLKAPAKKLSGLGLSSKTLSDLRSIHFS